MSTTGYLLRQMVDRLEAGARLAEPLPAMNRILFCHRGSFETGDGTSLAEDAAWYGADSVTVTAGPDGAVIWRWELAPEDSEPIPARGIGETSIENLSAPLNGPDPVSDWIMRCDSVKFPIGGTALTHTHQGPGIRCLRQGQIRIDTPAGSTHYLPGQAWFEAGPDPVFAQASELECTKFVRVMILPAELRGKSSIQYVNPDDHEKPKSQRYTGYVDEPIEH